MVYDKVQDKFYFTHVKKRVNNLGFEFVGDVKCNTKKENIYSYILENAKYYDKYYLTKDFDIESIKTKDPVVYNHLNRILEESNSNNFEELKFKVIDKLIKLEEEGELTLIIDNVVKNYQDIPDNKLFEVRSNEQELFNKIVEVFIKH